MPALKTGLRWLRRTRRGLIVAAIAVLLNGCVSLAVGTSADTLYSGAFRIKIEDVSKLTPDELNNARSIRLFASGQGLEASDRGPVAGLACKLSVAPLIPKFFWYPPVASRRVV